MQSNDDDKGQNEFYNEPEADGHFGPYGGRFVSETLFHALDELEALYDSLKNDAEFQRTSRRFASLMRQLCVENGGTFVGL